MSCLKQDQAILDFIWHTKNHAMGAKRTKPPGTYKNILMTIKQLSLSTLPNRF
ncbi:MAG: hypothetical protein ACK518_01280 [bacterium]